MKAVALALTLALVLGLLLSGCGIFSTGNTESDTGEVPQWQWPSGSQGNVMQPVDVPVAIKALLDSMSLEEKVGQLFLVTCPSKNPGQVIETYHLGGFILESSAFDGETPHSLGATLAAYQEASNMPMLIAVNEEGGSFCCVSNNKNFRDCCFPFPRNLLDTGGPELLLKTEREKCQMLWTLGINVNLAPVCDIATDPNAFMYARSLGGTPKETGMNIQKMLNIMNDYRIGSVLKHFPGYGNRTDPHVIMTLDKRTLEELEQVDLVPFRAGIDAGCGAIMVSHTIVTALDDKNPATLSAPVHKFMRNQMGFSGVILTDKLDMAAITDYYGDDEAAVLAVLAGNDLLCTDSYETQYDAVLKAVRSGRITMEQLDAAVLRVLCWKHELGLLDKLLEE